MKRGLRAGACALCWCAAALAAAAEHRVRIEGMAFLPRVVQARPGDTIVWENKDLFVHNVTATKGKMQSGALAPGQSWRYSVPEGGPISYICSLHPTMTGRIDVASKAPAGAKK